MLKRGQFALENVREDEDVVAHDRKSPKRGGCSTSFDCTVTLAVVNKMLIDIAASLNWYPSSVSRESISKCNIAHHIKKPKILYLILHMFSYPGCHM